MWNLIKKHDTNERIYKTETDLQILNERNLQLPKGKSGVGRGINQELGINVHTLLYTR